MNSLFTLVEKDYSNSLIKELNLNAEKELSKINEGSLLPIGSTYNTPSRYSVYDIVSSLVAYAIAEEIGKKLTLAKTKEEGLKYKEPVNHLEGLDLITKYEEFLKEEKNKYKKLKKLIIENINTYNKLIQEVPLAKLLPSNALKTAKNLASNYKNLFGEKGLKNAFQNSKFSLIYRTLNGDIELYLPKSVIKSNYVIFPFSVREGKKGKYVDDLNLKKYFLLDFIITNYLLQSKELGLDFTNILEGFTKSDYKTLYKVLERELNFSENKSKFVPLGDNLYVSLLSPLENNAISQLGFTNYSNPKNTAEVFRKAREIYNDKVVITPGVKVYLLKDDNLIYINNYKLRDLEKGNPISLERLIEQSEDIIKQTKEALKTKEFYEHYVIPIVLKS